MTTSLTKVVSTGTAADTAPAYRAHALGPNGSWPAYVEVEAEDDAQAIALTRVLAAFYPIALWHGARFLGRFTPEGDDDPPSIDGT